MADVVVFGAYATDIVATQQFFYGQTLSYSYQMLLILGTQLVGFSLGGFLRRFVVWPASMLWPSALVNAALFNTLHKNYGKTSNKRGRLSREKFFSIVLACGFVWYWIPGYLWTGISVFNWVCWAAPQNVVVNQLFGTLSGLGMSVLTLDWAVVSYMGSPLVTPVRIQIFPKVLFLNVPNSGGRKRIRSSHLASSSGLSRPSYTVRLFVHICHSQHAHNHLRHKHVVFQVFANIVSYRV
jgi:hypothetical protein